MISPSKQTIQPLSLLAHTRGFTLVEMIIVLVIAVMAMGIVGANFSAGLSGTRFKAAVNDVASALRYTRGQAISSGKEVVFTLDVDKRSYTISSRKKVYKLPPKLDLTVNTAETEINGEGKGSIRFFSDGSSTGGRVELKSDGRKRYVDINWLTGQILVQVADDEN
ncbi:MAG TPA: prepilin-type N-terminal cleavage/methylation domain-containing protein [Crenotrichaceae bacterium]|nr:prepilin-type N-terminal cleavage/methylation domain-containing protein [Crenotrichaceae bacterium]